MADERIAGRYRLLEPLGRGSMSAVWLAEDEELGRRVAVKTLAPSADRERFQREARAVAALSHPNICGLFDYGDADGRPFMVLEYLQGGSLEERLHDGPLADAETLRIATEVAAGLAHAHERGLVHRDLKPANILFDAEDRAKIADFGIARMGGTGTLTEAGTVLGTASYISPEQASGLPAGPASDVYSFGVILFRMLTGRLPFVSTNAMELVRMHRDDPPPAIHDVRPDVPARLESLTTAALAKDPAERPPDGRALLAELRGADPTDPTMIAVPAVPLGAEATQVIRPVPPAQGRRRTAALLGILAAVLVLGGVALALALTHGGGGGGTTAPVTTPTLTLPTAPTAGTTTTAPTTTEQTTTAPTTTAPTTSTAPTTTAPTTTRPETTAPTTTVAPPTTTVAPPPTTTTVELPPTTTDILPVTTDTVPTTTAP